jgi:glycosyltransferase involved in cell wall biosynthesis
LGLAAVPFVAPAADVVVSSFPLAVVAAKVTAWLRRAPLVNFVQGDDSTLFELDARVPAPAQAAYRLLTKLSYAVSRFPVANSAWSARRFEQRTGRQVLSVVHPGVDLERFRPPAPGPAAAVPSIVTVARTPPWKGFPDVLTALDLLARRGVVFACTAITAEPRLTPLAARSYPLRLWRPSHDGQVAAALRSGAVFVSASWQEGFSLPPLEAMACGVPVVLTDSGGPSEYASHEHNCLRVPVRQPQALADAIHRVLRDADLRARLIQGGLDTAARFSWNRTAERFERLLIEVVRPTAPLRTEARP